MIRRVLSGERGPARDIVLMNTAAALLLAGKASALAACAKIAANAIDTGLAKELLERLGHLTHGRHT
jgi:anthranilate phosphoribosyltransferase